MVIINGKNVHVYLHISVCIYVYMSILSYILIKIMYETACFVAFLAKRQDKNCSNTNCPKFPLFCIEMIFDSRGTFLLEVDLKQKTF